MARKIELTSGTALTRNFHPGAVRESGSRTTPGYWGNEQQFKANAEALKAAAADLANELAKQPKSGKGAVLLAPRFRDDNNAPQKTAVSPAIWEKFNTLSNTCESCHRSFRGRSW
jgi:cytochrome c556